MDASLMLLIPAYNAVETLPELISRCRKVTPELPIVVVNDGSRDNTADVLRRLEVLTLTHEHNRGKGEALKTGFAYAKEHGYEAVITLDADLQHAPESLPDFIAAYRTGKYDLLVGARRIALAVMPPARWATNKLTSWVISRMTGQHITDSQSGYRMIATALWHTMNFATGGYDLESEILIKAGRRGFRIGEVPIQTIYTGGASYINPLADSWRFIRLVWRNRRRRS
jgi:glycosyltransferase involved in cell wall biosynthesis